MSKQKRKTRHFALLLSLCLTLNLCVVPIAAAEAPDLERLESELEQAKEAREAAERAFADAQSRAEAADEAREHLEEVRKNLEDAAGEETDSLQEAVEKAEKALEAAEAAAPAQEELEELQSKVAEASTRVIRAQEAYDAALAAARAEEEEKRKQEEEEKKKQEEEQKRKEEEEKKKQEEEKRQALTPGSGDLSFSESSVNFGSLEKGASSGLSKTVTITNNGRYVMALSVSSPSGFSVSGVPSSLAPGKSAAASIALTSVKTAGEYSGNVQISGYYEDGGARGDSRTFSISVYAKVTEKGYTISADPSSKDMGKLKEGYSEEDAEAKEFTVTIENKGAGDVRLNGVKGADHFTVTAVKSSSDWLDSGKKAAFTIVPKQDLAAGTYTDKIAFQTREGATAECKVTLVIEKKLDPLTVEPGTLDFGSEKEGYSALSVKTVTVKNNTERAVRLEQPTSYNYDIGLLEKTSLAAGGSITFSIRPRTGLPANLYDSVIEVRGGDGEAAKLSVKFTVNRPAGPSAFSDVASGSTFAGDIAFVSQKGLMSGKEGGFFRPEEAVTRGQLVTILYRLEGQPAVSGVGFPDVAAGSYCEKAVKWAAANGITAGGADGLFRPDAPISREQLAAFLYRYNNHKGYQTAKQADLGSFSDGDSVASYARDALAWANGAGLVNGTSDGRLNPSGGATRGQAAAILHRFCMSIGM
ncbi:MAG: choice-of-anchor D domain-containing protein [Oscillibacter sp.]|nr:choice-of-anchor D domain-containing protein [Oscillibacter sp.]